MVVDPRWRENQEVFRAASGSADQLVPALEQIVESGHWREFEHPMRGLQRFERFSDYCSTFLRLDPKAVETLLDASMFKAAAGEVRRMLREDVQPVAANRWSGSVGGANSSQENDATYVLARLKRDRPDLAAEVIAGTLTANAAAVDAGIRHRYARIRTDDLDQAVAVLCRHYDPQQIRSALEAAS